MKNLKAKPNHLERRYERATFTLPPEVVDHLEHAWRTHQNIDGELCTNKSNYVADLIRRDAQKKR